MTRENYDAIIIGAGIAGLVASALLANKGFRTLIIEKRHIVGGRLTPSFFSGRFVDNGPHVFGVQGISTGDSGLLDRLNEKINWVDLEPLRIKINGVDLSIKWPPQKNIPHNFFTKNEINDLQKIVKDIESANPDELDDISLKDWLKERTESKKLYTLLSCLVTIPLTISDLSYLSTGEFIRTFRGLRSLDYVYPKNGSGEIVNVLRDAIVSRKGKFLLGYEVENVEIKGDKKIIRIRSDLTGEVKEVSTNIIVYNGLVYNIFYIIDKSYFPKGFVAKIKRLKGESTAGVSLIGGTRKKLFSYTGPIIYNHPNNARYLFSPTNVTGGLPYFFYGHYVEPNFLGSRQKSLNASKKLLTEFVEKFPNFEKYCSGAITSSIKIIDGLARKPGMTGRFAPNTKCEGIEGLFFVGDSINGRGNGMVRGVDTAKNAVDQILENKKYLFR